MKQSVISEIFEALTMADPSYLSTFQHEFHAGVNPFLTFDDEFLRFLRNHTKLLLSSDKSDKVWKVELDGEKLAGGWEEFVAVHNFRDGDVLVFRHDGDENFHVSVSSRSVAGDLQHASLNTAYGCIVGDDADFTGHDGGEDEDDNAVYDEDEDNTGNISVKKDKKPEADSSSRHFTACVTRYSIVNDRLDLSKDFNVVLIADKNKPCKIDLVNEQRRRWTLLLAKNRSSGVFYIRQGWRNFCYANVLSEGHLCKFKLVKNGERPVLWLCPQDYGNGLEEEECPEAEAEAVKNCSAGDCSNKKSTLNEVSKEKETPSPFLTVKITSNRYKTGQLYILSEFARKNGLEKSGEIILLNKDGRKWSSNLHILRRKGSTQECYYLRRGWREMCEVNGVKVNDSLVLELIWEDANPMFKFFSKIENEGRENQRTRKKRACETVLQPRTVEKTPRVVLEGRANKRVSRRPLHKKDGLTRASNKTNTHSTKRQRTQPKSCSISDQVTNVKRGIVDTLNTVRQFRVELETREQNLEASLLEIDDLGERILRISNILNNTLV